MYETKITQALDNGRHARSEFLLAKVEYKEQGKPWDEEMKWLSAFAKEEDQFYKTLGQPMRLTQEPLAKL
jgi:hypothetical protein